MNNGRILIIDDEVQIRRILEISLQSSGYVVDLAINGMEGIQQAISCNPDLILLDLGLPDINGHDVLKRLREWYDKAIIILSVLSSEDDIVQALDNGANDYIIKPFRTRELMARIRTVLRNTEQSENTTVYDFNGLTVNLTTHIVRKHAEIVKLTATEYTLLALFVRNQGRVLTHQYMLNTIWGKGYSEQSQYLRVFVAQLRKKIEDNPNKPQYILTESGVGYRFATLE